ncbi:MAG TPA: hypothetical protein VFO37_04495 [Chitinophagaceae bacterium]|nr:hypothetical protein [Chitinophagaceae bacterium]
MDRILKKIARGDYKNPPILEKAIKTSEVRKKQWSKIGKVILQGHKVKLHYESQLGAKRTYLFYTIDKGNWEGPSARDFSKMRKKKFDELFEARVTQEKKNSQEENSGEFFFLEEEGLLGSNWITSPGHVNSDEHGGTNTAGLESVGEDLPEMLGVERAAA